MNAHDPVVSNESLIGQYAGFATRIIAFVIDSMVVSVTLLFTAWFINSTLLILQFQNLIQVLGNWMPRVIDLLDFLSSPAMAGVYTFIIIVTYYVFFWTVAGQTIGKAVMGIKIIPVEGGRMSLGRSILRYFGYYISGLVLGFGFLAILFNDRRFAWHDRIARTCVVHVWDARPDEVFLVAATEHVIRQRISARKRLSSGKTDIPQHPGSANF